ncbi:MAG: hypothetical protein KJ064_00600 [Anaerolineae bacterium]|nr:hypothetical protein [Anaerolineae bacterium]
MQGLRVQQFDYGYVFCFADFSADTLSEWKSILLDLYEAHRDAHQPLLTVYDFRFMSCPPSSGLDYMIQFASQNPHPIPRATAILTAAHTLGLTEMAARRMPRYEATRVFMDEARAFDWLNQFV